MELDSFDSTVIFPTSLRSTKGSSNLIRKTQIQDPATGGVSLSFKPDKLGHSSFAQFWSNVIWTPMIMHGYRSLVTNPYLRVALFPLNIWWLEIVEGYIIMFIFGRNVAK